MKKTSLLITCCAAVLSALFISCQTVKEVVGTPTVSLESVAIKSLDMEGITFGCNYAITNPYPIGISIKEVAADVLCESSTFTKLSTDKGVAIAAKAKKTNTMNFKIPYTTILNFSKNVKGKKALPFSVKGSAALDLSAMTGLDIKDMTIPFTKNFDVPIIKPEFSVSDVQISIPSVTEMQNMFVNSGMSLAKAAALVSAITSGQDIKADAFKDIDMNIDMLLNLNVKNSGSSAWNFIMKNCSLKSAQGTLAALQPAGNSSISGEGGTIPLKATLNTRQAGALIAQIISKKGTNPTFTLASGLSFPNLPYTSDIPLSYSREIPLTNINVNR